MSKIFIVTVLSFAAAISFIVLSTVYREYEGMRPKKTQVSLPTMYKSLIHEVEFQSKDSLKLKAWYAPAKNGATIVLLHGYSGNRSDMISDVSLFLRNGFGVFAFDARAHGESEGEKITYGILEASDIGAAVDWLHARPELDAKRIGALGYSNGGVSLALHAAKDRRISAIALRSTPSNLYDFAYDESGLFPEFFAWLKMAAISGFGAFDAYSSNSESVINRISPRHVMVIAGEKDNVVPMNRTMRLWEKAQHPKQLFILPLSGHGIINEKDRPTYETALLGFFAQSLKVNTELAAGNLR